jgi:hypothetical protein
MTEKGFSHTFLDQHHHHTEKLKEAFHSRHIQSIAEIYEGTQKTLWYAKQGIVD